MRKIIYFCLIPLFTIAIIAGGMTTTVTTSTTFAKAGEIDTLPSATGSYSTRYYPTISWNLGVYGTDSIKVLLAFDGKIGDKWSLGVVYDTLYINETSATTAIRRTLLRGYTTTSLAGFEQFRARITFGAVGADDSLSALYYKAYIQYTD